MYLVVQVRTSENIFEVVYLVIEKFMTLYLVDTRIDLICPTHRPFDLERQIK